MSENIKDKNDKMQHPIIAHIVAHTENRVIGKDNEMPWHLPADLKYFKRVTMAKPVIMGRKTYESIGRPLPGRLNIVISRNKAYQAEGCEVVNSIVSALLVAARETSADEIMIIGGANLYEQTLPMIDRVYQTRIHTELNGDAFYPVLSSNEWQEVACEKYFADAKNQYDLSFMQFDRL